MRAFVIGLALIVTGCIPKIDPGPALAVRALDPVPILAQPDAEAGNVYLTATVAAGSRYDAVGAEGLAALTARAMVDGGAGERTAEEVRDALYLTGNQVEVVVARDLVTFRLRCHRDQAALCVEVFGDVLAAPRFETEAVERLRTDALQRLEKGVFSNEEQLAQEVLDGWIFEAHPYGHPVSGRTGVLPLLDATSAQAFHRGHYVRASTVVGVAGAVDDALQEALASRLVGLGTTMTPDSPLQQPLPVDGRSLLVVESGTPVTGFRFGHPIEVGRDHEDFPALYLAMTAFGAHRQSFGTLFRELRGARGLNYGTYAYPEYFRERRGPAQQEQGVLRSQATFSLWIRPTSTDNGPFALKLAVAELEDLVADGLSEEAFADTQAYLLGAIPMLARDPGRRLAYAVEAAATDTPDLLELLPGMVLGLSRDDVNAALQRHIRPDDLRIVAVSGDPAGLVAALEGELATPVVYGTIEPDEAQAARDAEVAGLALELVSATVVPSEGLFR